MTQLPIMMPSLRVPLEPTDVGRRHKSADQRSCDRDTSYDDLG